MRVLAVTNLYPTPEQPASGTFIECQVQSLRRQGLEVDLLLLDRMQRGVGVYLELRSRLGRRLETFRPHIVHVMYGGILAELVTRWVGDRPVVQSFCGTDLLGGGYFPLMRRLVVQGGVIASRRAARRAAAIIVKSQELAEALPPGLDPNRVWVIPNGVDMARFRPLDRGECRRRLGWSRKGCHVLAADGPDQRRKRAGLVVSAVERLRGRGRSVQCHRLRDVPHGEVPLWLNGADVVVTASIQEGSPNLVKEALACGRPVVSTDVGDVASLIADIDGCRLCRATPEALAEGILQALSWREGVSSRGRMKTLSLEAVAARVLGVYAAVLR